MLQFLTVPRIDGFPLWVVLLVCAGVFLASFMDAIAGGGGIISVPTHLIAFGNLPVPYALGTNKVSAAIGSCLSTGRFIKNGYVDWRLFGPAIAFALAGSAIGTWLQHLTPDAVLKYLLLLVLPLVAFFTLRGREWPDEPGEIGLKKQLAIIWAAAFIIGGYDGYYGPGTGDLPDDRFHPGRQAGHPPCGRGREGDQPLLQHRQPGGADGLGLRVLGRGAHRRRGLHGRALHRFRPCHQKRQ